VSTDGATKDRAELIQAAWVQHLGTAAAAPDTNFFEAGGNSLLAASMIGKLSDEFDRAVPMRLLARNPTLEQLSEAIIAWLVATAEDGRSDDRDRSWA
jgi:acyl carrier protein